MKTPRAIRPGLIDTRQFGVLTTLSGFPKGVSKPRWGGYLFRMATTGLTPFDHDQFVGEVGHMTVIATRIAGNAVARPAEHPARAIDTTAVRSGLAAFLAACSLRRDLTDGVC